jgi:hypothetical protein
MRHVCGDCASKREYWDPRARDRPPFYRRGAAQNHRLLAGKSAREIARILNDRNVATPTGKPWSAMTVIRVRDRLAAA